MGLNLFSSSSKSQQYDQSHNYQLNPTLDQPGGPAVAGAVDSTVIITDAGATGQALNTTQEVSTAAVQSARDVAYEAIAGSDRSLGQALAFGIDAFKTAAGASTESVLGTVAQQSLAKQETTKAVSENIAQSIKVAALVVGAVLLIKYWKG